MNISSQVRDQLARMERAIGELIAESRRAAEDRAAIRDATALLHKLANEVSQIPSKMQDHIESDDERFHEQNVWQEKTDGTLAVLVAARDQNVGWIRAWNAVFALGGSIIGALGIYFGVKGPH